MFVFRDFQGNGKRALHIAGSEYRKAPVPKTGPQQRHFSSTGCPLKMQKTNVDKVAKGTKFIQLIGMLAND